VGLSDRQLNEIETSTLEHGLNFSITPKVVPVAKILASVESGIYNLDECSKQEIRLSVTNVLKNAKPPSKRNVSKEEEKALKNLKKDQNIVILPADKGKAVVIMNRKDYSAKVHALLGDQNTYRKITDKRRNPTKTTEREMNKLLIEFRLVASTHDPEKSQMNSIL